MRIRPRLASLWPVALTAVLLLPAPARAQEARPGFRGGPYAGAIFSSIANPTFRYPNPAGGPQLSVPQSRSVAGLVAGYDCGAGYVGVGARGIYFFSAGFQSFATPQMPGSEEIVDYAGPKVSLFMFDMLVHWAPAASNVFSVYGLLGLGGSVKKYTVSRSVFPDWNGAQSRSEFEYSYGLGARVRPVKAVSAFAEFRFIPGDQTITGKNFLYSDGTYDYYEYGVASTTHFTRILSGGLAVHF
jgi:hypothetical protein